MTDLLTKDERKELVYIWDKLAALHGDFKDKNVNATASCFALVKMATYIRNHPIGDVTRWFQLMEQAEKEGRESPLL